MGVTSESKKYADWTKVDEVYNRAERQFQEAGLTYFAELRHHSSKFEEMTIIRNAIAHTSNYSRNEFEKVVRLKIVTAPVATITIGGFLGTLVPKSSPPQTFLESYMEQIRFVADLIVPN